MADEQGDISFRAMVLPKWGKEHRPLATLAEARAQPDGVVIFEGDEGGTIYLTVPATRVTCDADALRRLLKDIDTMCWACPDMTHLCFEAIPIGGGVAGGMGGGAVVDGLWLHERVETLGVRDEVEDVLAGRSAQIATAGRRWK